MIWKTRRQTLDLNQGGIVMGILNATPDSFSDGGRYSLTHQALESSHGNGRRRSADY